MKKRNLFTLAFFALTVGMLAGVSIVKGAEYLGRNDGQGAAAQETICGLGPGMLIRDAAGELFIPTRSKPDLDGDQFFIWWLGFEGNRGYMAARYPEIQYVDQDCVPYKAFINYIELLRTQETHETLEPHNIGCIKYWLIVRDSRGQHLYPAKTAPVPIYNGDFIWEDYDGKPNKISLFRNSEEPHRTVIWVTNSRCVWETIIDRLAEHNKEKKK